MKKYVISVILAFSVLFSSPISASAEPASRVPVQNIVEPNQYAERKEPKVIHIVIDGKEHRPSEVKALLVDNSMFVPLRFVSEQLGYSISWDAQNETAEINDGAIVAVLGEYTITKYDSISYPCNHASALYCQGVG